MDIFIQAINAAIVAEMQKPQETPAAFVLSLLQERAMRGARTKVFRTRDKDVRGQHLQEVRRGCKGLKPQQHTQGPLLHWFRQNS
jgi:hypothetical protein